MDIIDGVQFTTYATSKVYHDGEVAFPMWCGAQRQVIDIIRGQNLD